MRFCGPATWLFILAAPVAAGEPKADPAAPVKARQHVLSIAGDNNITFRAEAGLDPAKVEYRGGGLNISSRRRNGQEVEADAASASQETRSKASRTAKKIKKASADDEPAPKVASAVDIAIHAAEMDFLQNGQTVVQSRISRAKFQGRFMPDAPVLSVSFREAPPPLQDLFETIRRHRGFGAS